MRWYLRSKIHLATVVEADVAYEGSIEIDEDLVEQSGLCDGEKVLVCDIDNGERIETYVIPGPRGSGRVCMNGAAALRILKGHRVIIMGFELADAPVRPKKILVDAKNRFLREL
jgi:aspartate 1-decarboxylase